MKATQWMRMEIFQTKSIMIEIFQSPSIQKPNVVQIPLHRKIHKCKYTRNECRHVQCSCSCSLALACCSTQQEFQIKSHFQIICALIMCRNHKIEAYYTLSLLTYSVSSSLCRRMALNYQSMICDVACSRAHWINGCSLVLTGLLLLVVCCYCCCF